MSRRHLTPGATKQVKQSYAPVIQRLQKDLKIHLNWPVKKIDYTNPDAIKVTNARGEVRPPSRCFSHALGAGHHLIDDLCLH